MTELSREHEQFLAELDGTVAEAEEFFRHCPELVRDGRQTAREALAHLVFWHLEYVHIVEAMVARKPYHLRHGKFNDLNALAAHQVRDEPMFILARRLTYRQKHLAKALRQLRDWEQDLPVKADCGSCSVAMRVREIEAHIRGHVLRLRRVARRHPQSVVVGPLVTVDVFARRAANHHVLRIAPVFEI